MTREQYIQEKLKLIKNTHLRKALTPDTKEGYLTYFRNNLVCGSGYQHNPETKITHYIIGRFSRFEVPEKDCAPVCFGFAKQSRYLHNYSSEGIEKYSLTLVLDTEGKFHYYYDNGKSTHLKGTLTNQEVMSIIDIYTNTQN